MKRFSDYSIWAVLLVACMVPAGAFMWARAIDKALGRPPADPGPPVSRPADPPPAAASHLAPCD
jgi:hypothetical protein